MMRFEYFKGDYLLQEMASFKESNNNEFYFKVKKVEGSNTVCFFEFSTIMFVRFESYFSV